MASSDDQINRRAFFREGLRELLRPLVNAIEPIEQTLRCIEDLDDTPAQPDPSAPNIQPRPPRH